MEQDQQPPPPFAEVFADILEHVRTTAETHQSSLSLENSLILEEKQQEPQQQKLQHHHRNLLTPTPSRDYYLDQYIQALAVNQHLESFEFHFTHSTDICCLRHLHHHATLRSLHLRFKPRHDNYGFYFDETIDDQPQDVPIDHTIANFVGLNQFLIRVYPCAPDAPRLMQSLLRGISQNPSLRGLGVFYMKDFGLQEQLDWTESKLEKIDMEGCDFSISTWKSILSIPSLESLELATLLAEEREKPPARLPRHVLSRNHAFRSLWPVQQCRSIRNLIINWQGTDVADLENLIRFFEFETLTLDLRDLRLRIGEPVPPPQEFQENFSRICGLIDPTTNSKLHFVFDSFKTSTILSGAFPDVLGTILGFRAVVGIVITRGDGFNIDLNSSQCLHVLTEQHGGRHYLERLDISGIDAQDDDDAICKIIANFPRLQYLTTYSHPTPTIAEAVYAHPNLLKFDSHQVFGVWDKLLADRARDRIEILLCRNRANRFAQRIASRTACIGNHSGVAGLKLWPTILSSVDRDNVAAMTGVFHVFCNDIGRLLEGEEMMLLEGEAMVQETQEKYYKQKHHGVRRWRRVGSAILRKLKSMVGG